eukprot:TRINITY_DN7460_c0_g1_i1.p1 TRINITY_DN7460_c0_g1~~TRINITY_DN7460_c0_g1_i1.p1  ORF type:complete len:1129 (+),score=354.56 TRINITY_DN7460_c0_g1_i1:136-3387(+)
MSSIDVIELSIGLPPKSTQLTDTNKIRPNYSVSIGFLDSKDHKWVTAVENYDISENSKLDSQTNTRKVSMELPMVTSSVVVTLNYNPSITAQDASQFLYTLGAQFLGIKQGNVKEGILKRAKRRALLESTEFHLQLLATSQEESSRELRCACLEILAGLETKRMAPLFSSIQLHKFLTKNIVLADTQTSKFAASILENAAKSSEKLRDTLLAACLETLSTLADDCQTQGGMNNFFSVLNSCWLASPKKAYLRCVDVLAAVGKKLNSKSVSPLYTVLHTNFGLYGFPLEPEVFSPSKAELDKKKSFTSKLSEELKDSLSYTISTHSANISLNKTKTQGKITNIQKQGTFLVVDLGAVGYLSSVNFLLNLHQKNFATGNLTLSATAWTQNEDEAVKVFSAKFGQNAATENTQSFHDLSQVCRYVKVNIKNNTNLHSIAGATLSFDLHGDQEYPSPSLEKEALMAKLLSLLQTAEEKQLKVGLQLSEKRRHLTSLLEEVYTDESSLLEFKDPIIEAYNECIQLQIDSYEINQKIARYQELSGNSLTLSQTPSRGGNNFPRWTAFSEKLFDQLLFEKDRIENSRSFEDNDFNQIELIDKRTAEGLFRYFCVYASSAALRSKTSKFLSLVVHNIWETFPVDTINQYFSSKVVPDAAPPPPFPQPEVFNLILEMITPKKFFFVNQIFEFVAELEKNPQKLDIPMMGWVLLLLHNVIGGDLEKQRVVHPGSVCSGCHMTPIQGIRYRCVNCVNYDLCAECEANPGPQHNKLHLFLKIATPLPLSPSFTNLPPLNPTDKPLLPALYELQATPPEGSNATHKGTTCDGCGKAPIVGIRYKCVNCDEFNLCSDCQGTVEHYPLHLFLRVRFPLPEQTTLPKALIPNKALIPLLLHRSLYPTSAPKKKEPERSMLSQSLPLFPEEEPKLSGRHLSVLVSLLAAPACFDTLNKEVLSLGIQTLSKLAYQYTSDDVLLDVFKHSKFTQLLENVVNHADPFVQSHALDMFETLTKPTTYGTKEAGKSIAEARNLLRKKGLQLLTTRCHESQAQFLLNLIWWTTSKEDKQVRTRKLLQKTEWKLHQSAPEGFSCSGRK